MKQLFPPGMITGLGLFVSAGTKGDFCPHVVCPVSVILRTNLSWFGFAVMRLQKRASSIKIAKIGSDLNLKSSLVVSNTSEMMFYPLLVFSSLTLGKKKTLWAVSPLFSSLFLGCDSHAPSKVTHGKVLILSFVSKQLKICILHINVFFYLF